ncbi:MAG: phage tail tip lysozyme, partial [Monoglobaceae bacterium]
MSQKIKRILSSLLVAVMILSAAPLGLFNLTALAATNEEIVYNYFKNTMKVNTAVACGVLANIKAESNFNPTSSYTEKGGYISYGICQWNRGRLDNLKSFCSKNGLDYKSLNGQLAFLKSELEGSKRTVWNKIKSESNTEAGAYGAAYTWAKQFEVCAQYLNGVDQYVKRGNSAKSYWKKYGSNSSVLEYAMFPFKEIYISRTNSKLDPDQANALPSGGHVKYAFDLIGSDYNVKAPFTGIIKYIQTGGTHYVIFQSKNKVNIANGKVDYVTLMLCHDDSVSGLKVGMEIKQGDVFYHQGTYGNGKTGTYGRHLHIEAAIGKYSSLTDIRKYGSQLNDVLFLSKSTKRTKDYIQVSKKNGGQKIRLNWRTVEESVPLATKVYFNTPSADVSVGSQVPFSWSKISNATSYDVYVNNVKVKNVTGTSYSLKVTEAKKYEVKVIARNSVGVSPASNILSVTAHNPCNVTFVNWDDTPLTAEPISVDYGKNAIVPEIPVRESYTFTGWDNPLTNITSDRTIKAQFRINTYTVKFFDSNGNVIKTEKVQYNEAATAPTEVNAPTGYSFLGWSTDEFEAVKSDLNVYGIYDWGNRQLPISVSNVSATRQQDGYYVYFDLTNYPDAITRGRAVVSLKTAEGKLIDTTESAAFSIPKSGTKKQMEVFVPSDEVATTAELIIVNSYSSGVPISEMKSSEISFAENMWSNWSDTAPAEGTYSEIEERTLYRSSDKEFSTASTPTKDGWTYYKTTSTTSSHSTTSKVTAFSNDAQKRTVTIRKVDNKKTRTEYRYSHYQKGTSTSPVKYSGWNGPHYTPWMTSPLTKDGTSSAGGAKYKSKKCGTCGMTTWWYNQQTRTVEYVASTTTYYDYVDTFYTYHFYRWTDWTDWTDTEVAASDNKQVETKKQYRYVSNGAVVENNSGVERTISGNVGSEFAGKQLSLFVYKVDEASDFTNEFVGQQAVGADGSYSFTFKLREEPSAKTGDFTVAIGLEGSNNIMIIDTIKAPKPTFEVKFFVDGKQIGETQTVEQGSAAVLPENPTKEGYTFCGWSADTTNVQSNLEVEANMMINKYTVVFVDWVAETVSIKEFEHGSVLTYSDAAEIEGYTFAGWEELDGIDAVVTQNMVLTAKYDKDEFTVVFYDFDGNVIKQQNVEYGEAAELPTDPTEENMVFCGWESNEDLFVVTSDVEAYANFVYEDTCDTPYANIHTNEFDEPQTVTLSCDTANSVIYYTTDGSNPSERTEAGNTVKKYTDPIEISKNTVLKFYAECDGMNSSEVAAETYVISNGSSDSNLMIFDDLPAYVIANPSKYNVHTETGYKYKDITSVNVLEDSYDLENDGWTKYGESFSDWSEWSNVEPDGDGMMIETETKEPDPVDTPFYQYKHWKYYDADNQTYVCSNSEVEGYEGEWETVEFLSSLPVTSFVDGKPAYNYNDELWFSQTIVIKGVVPDYLLYRYRIKSLDYYKWTDWTEKAPTADETRENISDTVYRYTVPASHLVTVHTDNEVGDVYYIVFENETVSVDTELFDLEGYRLIGLCSDAELTSDWDVENDVVMSKLDLYPKYAVVTNTVTFKDIDGSVLLEQEVNYGESAVAPEYVCEDGYTFLGWDKDFDCITEETTVTAISKLTSELITATLNIHNKTIYADSMYKLIATVSPESATEDDISWTSSNNDVATVDDSGVVTAVSAGT